MTTRRGFLGMLSACLVTRARRAPAAITSAYPCTLHGIVGLGSTTGTIAGIDRATFPFWRNTNQRHSAIEYAAIGETWDRCVEGGSLYVNGERVR